jgi:hypothetical protein
MLHQRSETTRLESLERSAEAVAIHITPVSPDGMGQVAQQRLSLRAVCSCPCVLGVQPESSKQLAQAFLNLAGWGADAGSNM